MIVVKKIKDIFLIGMGVVSASFGLKGFLLPHNFIDGGAVGMSLLLAEISHISFSYLLVIVNIPFVILGWRTMGKEFTIKTASAIILLAFVVAVVPFPEITSDKLLIAVFGGFFLGLGVGLAVRGGCVIDGTEVLAINVSKKIGLTFGDIILFINILIFSFAAYLLSPEIALYSILTYVVAAKIVDFVIHGVDEYTAVTIISPEWEKIRMMIIEKLGRGVTIYKGAQGFGKKGHIEGEMNIVYTVLTRIEVNKLNTEIEKIDSNAFVIMNSIKDTKGGMIKKKPLGH